MKYIVKNITISTPDNPNFPNSMKTYFFGKDGYVHEQPEYAEPWSRKHFAESYIAKQIEDDKHIWEIYPDQRFWTDFYEVIEVE